VRDELREVRAVWVALRFVIAVVILGPERAGRFVRPQDRAWC
jgi:hypothetical protein